MSTARASQGRSTQQPNWVFRGVVAVAIGVVLLVVYLGSGGKKGELPTKYGQRRGTGASDSVNGTAVLAEFFEQQDHRVNAATHLSRRLDLYKTIVWAPDDFGPPSLEARQFLDAWLTASSGRTLVYIGRDYDAATDYWKRMLAQVDDEQHDEYQRRLAHVQSEFAARRAAFPQHEPCEWFTMENSHPTRKIPDLDGPWAHGVDAAKTDIVLAGRLDVPEGNETSTATAIPPSTGSGEITGQVDVLLQSENDILAHRFKLPHWSNSQVIVIANGSFTLNMGLVNKEHRKLAAKLVAECGSPGRVAFLESGPKGISVDKGDAPEANNFAFRIFMIWPVSLIFIHFAALGIAYCISVFPIFGRARALPAEGRSDFGQHIAALGELFQKTKDTFFAESRIRQYQTLAKRTSGQAHRTAATTALPAAVIDAIEIKPADIKHTAPPSPPAEESAKTTA
jgi:hypothetical protein